MFEVYRLRDKDNTFSFCSKERRDLFEKTLLSHRVDVKFVKEKVSIAPTRQLLIELDKDPIKYAVSSVSLFNKPSDKLTEEEVAYILKVAYKTA